jgi:mannitol/fructose-specific phosphotransferase system IIA component (Ntr-type)
MPGTKIIRHIREEHCVTRLEGASKEEVILELARRFVASGQIDESQQAAVVATVMEREDKGTTGIGNGVALPHQNRPEDVTETLDDMLVAVGIHQEGVDFSAIDGAPVHVVFLVVSPDGPLYLQMAKRIAALARDKRWAKVFRQSRTTKMMRETLEEAWADVTP